MRQGGVEVGRLRVHGDTEPLRLRLGVERLLAAADLVGRRLPPAAVLVVRTLHDPLPGRVDVSRVGPDRVWEQRVRDHLDDLLLRAARPGSGPVDPSAPAVLFADRAELLACAWRDLRHTGRAGSWWWRTLRLEDVPALLVALDGAAPVVPAVVERLGAEGHLEACTGLLGPAQAEALAERVAEAFGRRALVHEARTRVGTEVPLAATPTGPGAPRFDPRGAPVPDPPSPGAVSRALLVEVCRALVASSGPRQPQSTAGASAHDVPAGTRREAARPAVTAGGATPRTRASRAPDTLTAESPTARTAGRAHLPPETAWSDEEPTPPADVTGAQPGLRRTRTVRLPADRGSASPGAPTVADAPRSPDAGRTGADLVVSTRLGGVFHLLQVAQGLGLYSDFTSPVRTGIRLDPWDFVTLVARALDVGSPDDPVWPLLAHLGGRDGGKSAGAGFRPPRTWRVPSAWLEPVDTAGEWTWRVGGRPALVHPRGFVVATGSSLRRDRECGRYAATPCRDVHALPLRATARERWVDHLAGYLRIRLADALGVRPSRAARTLCRRPARVHVTVTRVDVVSELADLRIEVRRAGLDRDLGFVPAAGRSIGFVFR